MIPERKWTNRSRGRHGNSLARLDATSLAESVAFSRRASLRACECYRKWLALPAAAAEVLILSRPLSGDAF